MKIKKLGNKIYIFTKKRIHVINLNFKKYEPTELDEDIKTGFETLHNWTSQPLSQLEQLYKLQEKDIKQILKDNNVPPYKNGKYILYTKDKTSYI